MRSERALVVVMVAGLTLLVNANAQPWTPVGTSWLSTNSQADSMLAFNGSLYVGTANFSGGSQVWTFNGVTWTNVTPGWPTGIVDVWTMSLYGGRLYVGTQNFSGAAQVWRTDGTTWKDVSPAWPTSIYSAMSMATTNGLLYVGTAGSGVPQVWSYDGTNWTNTSTTTPPWNSAGNRNTESMAAYNGLLYIGFYNNSTAQVWSYDGATFKNVITGTPPWPATARHPYAMTVFEGRLYVAFRNAFVFRFDGHAWTDVTPPWSGVSWAQSLTVFNRHLYVGTYSAPGQVWSYDGTTWSEVSPGWGSGNSTAYSLTPYASSLYAGSTNYSAGAEIWSTHGRRRLARHLPRSN